MVVELANFVYHPADPADQFTVKLFREETAPVPPLSLFKKHHTNLMTAGHAVGTFPPANLLLFLLLSPLVRAKIFSSFLLFDVPDDPRVVVRLSVDFVLLPPSPKNFDQNEVVQACQ